MDIIELIDGITKIIKPLETTNKEEVIDIGELNIREVADPSRVKIKLINFNDNENIIRNILELSSKGFYEIIDVKSSKLILESLKDTDIIFIIFGSDDEKNAKTAESLKEVNALTIAMGVNETQYNEDIDTFFLISKDNVESIYQIIKTISNLFIPNIVNADFVEFKDVAKGSNIAYISISESGGENAIINAMKLAINSVKDNIQHYDSFLVQVTGMLDLLNITVINKSIDILKGAARQDAKVVWGVTDTSDNDKIKIALIAIKSNKNL